MPNLATVLKDEIRRLARKEARAAVRPLSRDKVALKRRVADLSRRVVHLEKDVTFLVSQAGKTVKAVAAAVPVADQRIRITAKGMRSLRRKLGLTQAEFAALVGVTAQAVYQWESKQGALRVRERVKRALVTIRNLGAREARRLMAELGGARISKRGSRGRRKK